MSIVIKAAGLACPLGLRRAPAIAAMRAGISPFESDDLYGEVCVAATPTLDPGLHRGERMLALLSHALDEALGQAPADAWPENLPVFVVLPSMSASSVDSLLAGVRERIETQARVQPALSQESVISGGRAGVFTALTRAQQVLEQGRAAQVMIVAADSLVDRSTLRELYMGDDLLGPANRDGRIVGEAAAALLVSRPEGGAREPYLGQLELVAELRGEHSFAGFRQGRETNRALSLSALFAQAARAAPGRRGLVVSAQPSESYWAREFSYAYLRNVGLMPEPLRFESTGDQLGDTGASAGAVALIRALSEFQPARSGWREPVGSALAYAVSDDGHHGLALLRP